MIRFLIQFHRVLGTLFAGLFLMWFLSGFVMMYKSFPSLKTKEYAHLTALPENLPSINSINEVIPEEEKIKSLSLEMFREQPTFRIRTTKSNYLLSADSLLTPLREGVPFSEIEAYAKRWSSSAIGRVDTLYRLDQWIPYAHYKDEFPIYKFRFNDNDKSYFYVSSVTGRALQHVTRSQRVWSWLGPIPHMLYFWQFRQHRSQWITLVSWLAGIGALMCLAGIVLGIWRYVTVYKRRKKFRSPYRKFYFKWHHILGFIFGFFVFMFVLSGLMSFNSLPNWIVKTHDSGIASKVRKSSNIELSLFETDYRKIISQNDGRVKQISFEQYGSKPYYSVTFDDKRENLDAESELLEPLYLSENDVLNRLSEVSTAPKTISLMAEFDNYYVGFTKRMELPVYKVVVDDKDRHVFYVNPKTGRTRFYNTNSRVKKWIYPAFHSLRFKFFVEHRVLRDIVLWTLMIGGTLVSFTGFVLGIKYIFRLIKKRRRKRKRSY